MGFYYAAFAHLLDEVIPHICQSCVSVQPGIVLHLNHRVFNQFPLILAQLQLVKEIRFPLNQLGGTETAGDIQLLGMILDNVAHCVDTPVDRTIGTEIQNFGLLFVLGCFQKGFHQFRNAFILGSADRHHRCAKSFRHFPHIDASTIPPQLVHHIQSNYHRHLQGQKLQRQIQISFNIGGIQNIDNGIGLLFQQKLLGHHFLLGIGTYGVNAWQIHHLMGGSPKGSHLLIYGHTGEVSHMLIGTGEAVEQGGFTAILISCQCKNHSVSSRKVIFFASSLRRVSS